MAGQSLKKNQVNPFAKDLTVIAIQRPRIQLCNDNNPGTDRDKMNGFLKLMFCSESAWVRPRPVTLALVTCEHC